MEYSETGNFTKEQRAICRKISELIRTARKKGLVVNIDASLPIEEVWQQVRKALGD